MSCKRLAIGSREISQQHFEQNAIKHFGISGHVFLVTTIYLHSRVMHVGIRLLFLLVTGKKWSEISEKKKNQYRKGIEVQKKKENHYMK